MIMMMMMIEMDWGDMNKHCHPDHFVFEDIIIMMECDEIV